jgi:hypothetical protein
MNFTSVPHLLIGTTRIALMHRRLAMTYLKLLPIKILPAPFPMPRLVEVIQWHKYREADPGRLWLHGLLKAAAAAAH